MTKIYLDHNASTPIHPQVSAAMQDLLDGPSGNPSSLHWAGAPARASLDASRRQVADLFGCAPDEIVFTSGGSEASNFAIKGTYFHHAHTAAASGAHIITSAVEHPATIEPCRFLERAFGVRVSVVPVDATGWIDPEDVRQAIAADTILISIMHANNEVGTIQPVTEIAAIAREHGVCLHVDAAQSIGKIATNVDALGADLLTVAGHKLYAPKGVGALYVRGGIELEPLIHGGGHEGGRRAGTESALLAAALGTACELAADLAPMTQVRALRDRFWGAIRASFGDRVVLNGDLDRCLPNTLNVSFLDHVGAELLGRLDGVAASTGSACHEDRIELSPVLAAMGVAPQIGRGAVRFSLGRTTTESEIDTVVEQLAALA